MSGLGLGEAVQGGLGGSDNTSVFSGFIGATRTAMQKLEEEDRLEEQAEKTDEVVKLLRAPTRILGSDSIVRRTSNAAIAAGHQKKQAIIIAWMNKYLGATDVRVRNLSEALADGTVLIELLQQLSGFKLKFFHKKPTEEKDIFENLNVLMKFLFFLNIDAHIKPDAIFKGDSAQIVRLMLTIIEKFKSEKGKRVALEHAASAQVVDINPDSGFLRVMLRQREKEKTELDLKAKMERARQESEQKARDEAREVAQAPEAAKETVAVDPLPKAPSNVKIEAESSNPTIEVVPPSPRTRDSITKSTSNLVRALSVLRKEKEKVTQATEDLSLDDLSIDILNQDILDLDSLDIEAAQAAQDELIEAKAVQVVQDESVLDDLDTMEAFLQSIAAEEHIEGLDL
eukprot:TRINITY_DN5709_c0_g1_i1.p1 TRINITY_DN5709_c0_g1~~TRINITY_DN5709_c0_g1_i1.p1  ORF type:complete len:399 (+),score=107.68 TRINITY_DN5709_c0_g1_i1:78-1274(+)